LALDRDDEAAPVLRVRVFAEPVVDAVDVWVPEIRFSSTLTGVGL